MKKIIKYSIFVFTLISFITANLGARIIGASWWEKEGKKVLVYHDSHDEATEIEISARDFAYLRGHSIPAVRAESPCTLVVENYCCGPYKLLMEAFDRDAHAGYRFLSKFNDIIDTMQNGVPVKSVEVRTPLCLLGAWVRESIARARGAAPTGLSEGLHLKILGQLKDISINSLVAYVDGAFRELRTKNSDKPGLLGILSRLNIAFDRHRASFLQTLAECGLEDRFGTPLVRCALQDLSRHDYDHYVDLLCSSVFACGFFVPLMEARLISEVVNTPGTVAVFAGISHSMNIEKMLKDLEFERKHDVNQELLQFIDKTTQTKKFDVRSMHELLSDAHLDDPSVFDWII